MTSHQLVIDLIYAKLRNIAALIMKNSFGQKTRRFILNSVFYLASLGFFASGSVDLYSDAFDDINGPQIVEYSPESGKKRYQAEEMDNDEVWQALGKGAVGILTLLLGAKTDTRVFGRDSENTYFLTQSKALFKSESEIAVANDLMTSVVFNRNSSHFTTLIRGQLSRNLNDQIEISELIFEKRGAQLNATMKSQVRMNPKESVLVELVSGKLSEVIENLLGEKVERAEDYAKTNELNFLDALETVIKIQLKELKGLITT